MSLKVLHLIFISASTALALGCTVWGLKEYFSEGGRSSDLVFGLGALVVAIALILYERYFLRKLKRVGNL